MALSAGVVAARQGVRITLADGYSFEVDEVWKQGDETWYRKGSVSRRLEGSVKKLTPLEVKDLKEGKDARDGSAKAAAEHSPIRQPGKQHPWRSGSTSTAATRVRVDEVTETTDGAWYRRGNLSMFLERERIVRIEREQPATAAAGSTAWRENGWTSEMPVLII